MLLLILLTKLVTQLFLLVTQTLLFSMNNA